MGKIRQYSLIDIYCYNLRRDGQCDSTDLDYLKNRLSEEVFGDFTQEFEHFCLKGTNWYMLYTVQYKGKDKFLDIDFLSVDTGFLSLDKAIEIRRAFEELFLTYGNSTFRTELENKNCKLLKWAASKGIITIIEKDVQFDSTSYEFKPSKNFLNSIKNKTCTAVRKPSLDLLSKEKTMKLPRGIRIIKGKRILSRKIQKKIETFAQAYTDIKGCETDLWFYEKPLTIEESRVDLIGDGWHIEYSIYSSSIVIDFWNFSKWGLKQAIEMKETLKEMLYAYRDMFFIAACNKHSMKWIEKMIEWGFIEIIKKEDLEEYEEEDGYRNIIFKVTSSFIDYYRSHGPKKHVMKPIKHKDNR